MSATALTPHEDPVWADIDDDPLSSLLSQRPWRDSSLQPDIIQGTETTMQQIRKVLERVQLEVDRDESPPRNLGLLVRLVSAWLEGLDSREISKLLSFTPDQFRKVLHGQMTVQPSKADRLLLVTDIVQSLEKVLKPEAVGEWFHMRIPDLGNSTPYQIILKRRGEEAAKVAHSYLDPSYS